MLGERRHEALRIQTTHEADVARVMVPEEFAVAGTGPAAEDEEGEEGGGGENDKIKSIFSRPLLFCLHHLNQQHQQRQRRCGFTSPSPILFIISSLLNSEEQKRENG